MFQAVFRRTICAAATFALLVSIDGCKQSVRPASENRQPSSPAPTSLGRFEPTAGRGPDIVTELRATPAPQKPEFSDGESASGDERVLSAKGFVKIADGYYGGVDAEANAWLRKRGNEAGADKVIFYTVPPDETTRAPSLHAVYYVRFKLPFGASFRTLTDQEHDELGATGVRIGAVIGGSPAAEANLRVGDIVLKIDGVSIAGRSDFEKKLRAHMGKRVSLTISRDGTVGTRLVRLGVLASELGK